MNSAPLRAYRLARFPVAHAFPNLALGYQIKGSTPSLTVNDGKLAFTQVFSPRTDGTYGEIVAPTRGFGRFCSATLGFDAVGFDRPIHLTGEENGAPNNFYGDGSVATATFDGAVHVLPDIGKADWENVVPVPFTNEKTVVILDEMAERSTLRCTCMLAPRIRVRPIHCRRTALWAAASTCSLAMTRCSREKIPSIK